MTRNVRRVLRPQNLAAILGMGILAVAITTFATGGNANGAFQVLAAAVGMVGGATAVYKDV